MSLNVNSFDSDSINTLFSSLSGTKSSNSYVGIEGLLSDYTSLKTGSYGKLLKAYYTKAEDTKSTSKNKDNSEVSELKEVKADASSLSESAEALLDKKKDSIWQKITTTDADGKETTDYDKDKIYNALSKFIDSYNSLVDSSQESDVTGVLTQAASMVTTSSTTASSLAKAGITIGKNNHLSIDETFFKNKADMTVVKGLFNGNGSFAYSVATKASMINSYATARLSEISGSKSYTSKGSYTVSSSDLLSSINTNV